MREEILYAIFLDLHNAYAAFDRKILLEILKGYGMGHWVFHILCVYWDRIKIVSFTGVYYWVAFRGFWDVTHEGPLFPTIFNVMVDAVVRYRISLEVGGAGSKNRWGRGVLHRTAFLCYCQSSHIG